MAEIACPVCGRLNPEESAFCGRCGSPLTAPASEWYPTEERKVVTVAFVDLSDFSVLGGTVDPETSRTLVARFFAAAREEIRRLGGSVEKFIGDAVMAVFGLPAAHEDDPARAVEAALAIRRRLETLNEAFRAEFGLAVSIHVGINTGEVLAAAGPAEGRDFLITGDAVNVAARLHELARPNQILVGERTYRFGRRLFSFRPAGALSMKGRDQPLPAWEAVGPLPAAAARVGASLVGRAEELRRLRVLYAETVAARRPHIVVVTGHPGIGKSRLVAELRDTLTRTDPSLVFRSGRCLPRGEAITYLPLADMLKQECGITEGDSPETARAKVGAAVAAVGAGDVADALAYTIGLDVPGSPVALLDPRSVGQELVRAWRIFFEAKARARPLAVIFEDLHWAGDPLLELIEGVAGGITDAPLLVLGTARLDLIERRRRWGQSDETRTIIRLDPLSRLESDRLLDNLLPLGLPSAFLREMIVERAEGNPFFIEEMVRMLADEGVVVQEEGRWRLGPAPGEFIIPDTIQAVIAARIDHLPLGQKAALQQAAVIGRTFWLGALRALAGDADVGDAVEALERKEFIQAGRQPTRPGEREYAFKHVLTHEVAYGSLPRGARGRLHLQLGEWLERASGSRLSEAVDLLAHHFQQAAALTGSASARQRAAAYLRQAAESAYRRHALDQAVANAQAALPLIDEKEQGPLYELLGDALFLTARSTEAEQFYREALARYTRALDQARARRKLAPALRMDASPALRMDAAEVELKRAQELLAADPDPTEEAAVLTWLGRIAHYRMAYDQAVSALNRARAVLGGTGKRPDLAWSLLYLCDAQIHLGRYADAFAAAEELLDLSRALQNPYFTGLARWELARTRFVRGTLMEALTEAEQGVRAAEAAGNAELTAGVLGVKGMVLGRLGRLRESEEALRAGLAVSEGLPEAAATRAGVAETLSIVLADLGRHEEAEQTLRPLWEAGKTLGRSDLLLRAAVAHLRVLTARGDPREGLEACENAVRQWSGSRLLRVQALEAMGLAWTLMRTESKAKDAAEECLRIARQDGAAFEALTAQRILGRAALLRQEWAGAFSQLSDVADQLSRMGARLEWARTLADASAAAGGMGREMNAQELRRRAVELLAECGASTDLLHLEQMRA